MGTIDLSIAAGIVYEEAIASLEKTLELNSKNANAYYYLGLAWQKLKNYSAANQIFERAISLIPEEAIILNGKAGLLYALKDYQKAIFIYHKLIETNPDDASAWYNLACCHALQGNSDRAIAELEKAIKLNPQFKDSAKNDSDFASLSEQKNFQKLLEN